MWGGAEASEADLTGTTTGPTKPPLPGPASFESQPALRLVSPTRGDVPEGEEFGEMEFKIAEELRKVAASAFRERVDRLQFAPIDADAEQREHVMLSTMVAQAAVRAASTRRPAIAFADPQNLQEQAVIAASEAAIVASGGYE